MQEKALDYINAIIVITVMITLVAAFVLAYLLYFKKRKSDLLFEKESLKEEFQLQLLQSQIEVQETTYSTLAKELHDNIGQLLSTAKMLLALTERKMEQPPDTLVTATATVGQAIHEVRALSRAIDKEWLAQFSFNDNINAEILRINTGGGIIAECTITGTLNLQADAQLMLFRVVQEAVQNAVKHAAASSINIIINVEPENLSIQIVDDGKGFDWPAIQTGMGVNNMKRRVSLLGGTIYWQPVLPTGTVVNINLPKNLD